MDVIRMFQVQGEAAILEEELSLLNRLRELRRRRGADDYSGFHKRASSDLYHTNLQPHIHMIRIELTRRLCTGASAIVPFGSFCSCSPPFRFNNLLNAVSKIIHRSKNFRDAILESKSPLPAIMMGLAHLASGAAVRTVHDHRCVTGHG
eukprot:scaffold6417_cov87-Cyclotella_meneghiniana.AAC.3